jgi:hypothetical protein
VAVLAGGQRQAQIPFDSAEGRLLTRCAGSGRQVLLEVEIRAVPPFRKDSVVGLARSGPEGAPAPRRPDGEPGPRGLSSVVSRSSRKGRGLNGAPGTGPVVRSHVLN